MQKIIIDNKVIVHLDSGAFLEKICTKSEIDVINNTDNENTIISILLPDLAEKQRKAESLNDFLSRVKMSNILSLRGNIIYWKGVSPLSLPQDLAQSILDAECNNEVDKIETYKNFWTLLSLNIDGQCRTNLYWFLQTHGLVLAKCGFFIAYRNVCKTKEKGVYTDNYTHTFRIKIGEMVVVDEKQVDCNSDVECSKGLHVASAKWLKYNYFGDTGLACLVNPADVRAVPHRSEYGKLRTRAYLPISTISFDERGNVIPLNVETGFDCSYVSKVIYEGIMGTEEDSPYKIIIPKTTLDKKSIQNTLFDIALKCITEKNV